MGPSCRPKLAWGLGGLGQASPPPTPTPPPPRPPQGLVNPNMEHRMHATTRAPDSSGGVTPGDKALIPQP